MRRFLRAAYRATLARRAPALRAQYGGRACEPPAVSRLWLHGYIGYPSTEGYLEGGCAFLPPRGSSASWRVLWPKWNQEAAKRRPRRLLFRICFVMPFWIVFLSIFPPNLAPSWLPNFKKIDEKSIPRCLPKLRSIFDQVLIDVSSNFDMRNLSNHRCSQRKTSFS